MHGKVVTTAIDYLQRTAPQPAPAGPNAAGDANWEDVQGQLLVKCERCEPFTTIRLLAEDDSRDHDQILGRNPEPRAPHAT